MCGIAGFSLGTQSTLDGEIAARVLLASIAERGADAAGLAYVENGAVVVDKQPGGASRFLEQLQVSEQVRTLLLHVRDHTKGTPALLANNHPIRHGRIVGVHNGKISNDDALFAQLGRERAEPGMTVDSEAIFALLDASAHPAPALAQLRGSLATGWFDEAHPQSVFLARGYARPLWVAATVNDNGVELGDTLWASTLEAIQIAEELLGIRLRARPLRPGTILEISGGAIVAQHGFRADASADWLANPVASPAERTACFAQLAPRIAV